MMKFYVFASFLTGLFLSPYLFAVEEEIKPIIHLIEKINKPNFPNSAESICKAQCETMDPRRQCAVDLCGAVTDNIIQDGYLRDLKNDNFDKFNKYDFSLIGKLERQFDQEIKPVVLQTIRIRANKAVGLIQNPSKKSMEQLKRLASASEDLPIVLKVVNQCKSRFITRGISEETIKQFKNKYKQYIQRFLNKVFIDHSRESKQSFANYINNKVVFQFPQEDIAQGFKKALQKKQEEAFRLNTDFTDICPRLLQGESLFEPDKVKYSTFRKQKIKISFFSCQFHDHGKQILSHELAHLMDYFFNLPSSEENRPRLASGHSYKQYIKLKKCARNRYINDKTKSLRNIFSPFFYWKDKQQTEEIMADLLAYLAFQEEPDLFTCTLFRLNHLMEYSDLTVYNNNNTNRHPSTLLRVLMEAIHKKKKLSSACRQVMDQYKNKINFQPCF